VRLKSESEEEEDDERERWVNETRVRSIERERNEEKGYLFYRTSDFRVTTYASLPLTHPWA